MTLLKRLWKDECGLILSAEMVTIGTLGVIGVTAGLSMTADAVNEELVDLAKAFRSLDQSYCVSGFQGSHCNGGQAFTAGSSFQQEAVEESLSRIRIVPNPATSQTRAEVEDSDGTFGDERTQNDTDASDQRKSEAERLQELEQQLESI